MLHNGRGSIVQQKSYATQSQSKIKSERLNSLNIMTMKKIQTVAFHRNVKSYLLAYDFKTTAYTLFSPKGYLSKIFVQPKINS